jgi:hypothetical protein
MNKLAVVFAGMLVGGLALAENVKGVNEIVCAPAQVQICVEHDQCYSATPSDLNMPDFVVIDLRKKTVSTTKASHENRSTPFTSVKKKDGLIFLQGIEGERAFSFVIEEASGKITVAISSDGLSVSVFGACTDTDL